MLVSFLHGLQDVTLTFNIFNSVLTKNIKSWYYETTHWDESNKIPHEYVFFIYTNENIGSKILKVDPLKMKKALYYGTEGVICN